MNKVTGGEAAFIKVLEFERRKKGREGERERGEERKREGEKENFQSLKTLSSLT